MTGKKILLTGASSGIGRETACILDRLGAQLILVARNKDNLIQTQRNLQGNNHIIESYDLNKIDAIPAWLKSITDKTGSLHGLVHSAGIHLIKPIKFLKQEDIQKIFDINIAAAIGLIKAFSQKNVCHTSSSVVLLSSVAGLAGQSAISAYSASKGALIALTRAVAIELAPQNIRINCVAPGVVQTEMTEKLFSFMTEQQLNDIKKMHLLGIGHPSDVGNAIAFLLADISRWITGSVLVVDGGYTAH